MNHQNQTRTNGIRVHVRYTLVRVLLYGHVVHVSSCSLVLVSRHERVATVGDFYTGNAMQ
jgi:hypothetical protein